MELKEFIKSTISSISEAIEETQNELGKKNVLVNPEYIHKTGENSFRLGSKSNGYKPILDIQFDVKVEASETKNTGAGAGITASILNVAGSKSKDSNNKEVSSIKFNLPIALPYSN